MCDAVAYVCCDCLIVDRECGWFLSYMSTVIYFLFFFFSSRRRHTRLQGDWSSDVCSSDLRKPNAPPATASSKKPTSTIQSRADRGSLPPLPSTSRPCGGICGGGRCSGQIGRASCRGRV